MKSKVCAHIRGKIQFPAAVLALKGVANAGNLAQAPSRDQGLHPFTAAELAWKDVAQVKNFKMPLRLRTNVNL